MWRGNTIYFLSDRGPNERNNIWADDVTARHAPAGDAFDDFDITFPSIGPDGIVFQAGGRLYFAGSCVGEDSAKSRCASSPTRRRCGRGLRRRIRSIESAAVSPTGKRAVFEARGDIFTVPAEIGAVVNVTRSSGVAERYPRWSPDGKTARATGATAAANTS